MNGCFGAQFEGTPKGGSVTWRGTGIFQARLVGNNFKYFHLGTERKGQ